MTTAKTACTLQKGYTGLKPDPSKQLGRGPGGGNANCQAANHTLETSLSEVTHDY